MRRACHNCRIKSYPDGSREVLAASYAFGGGDVDRPPKAEEPEPTVFDALAALSVDKNMAEKAGEEAYALLERVAIQDDGPDSEAQERRKKAGLDRARRRARTAVRDLALSNDFRWFVTLTLDPERIDRYDAKEVVRKLNGWLDNSVRRYGLAYVIVPEHHKDGAIHFHGFFNDALEAVYSGHKDGHGHPVYNLPRWTWGFSTAIQLYGTRAAAVAYVCKYVSKAQEKIGGRWYYSGGALKRPEISWEDVDFEAFLEAGAAPFEIPELPWARYAVQRITAEGEVQAREMDSVSSETSVLVNEGGPGV